MKALTTGKILGILALATMMAFAACGGDDKIKEYEMLADTGIKIVCGEGVTEEQFVTKVETVRAGYALLTSEQQAKLPGKLDEIRIVVFGGFYSTDRNGKYILTLSFSFGVTESDWRDYFHYIISGSWLPIEPITPPVEGVIILTANQWAEGNIPAVQREQFFKFTATAAAQYVHFQPGYFLGAKAYLYDSSGNVLADEVSLSLQDRFTMYRVTIGQVYYIRAVVGNQAGNYFLTFNTEPVPPGAAWPPANISTLTANQWAEGNMENETSAEWFKFTATAATHFFHYDFASVPSYVRIRVYDSSWTLIGGGSGTQIPTNLPSFTVTIGREYYVQINYDSGTGAYRIGFNTSSITPPNSTPPTGGVTTLTPDTWHNGTVAAERGVQWFKFTATRTGEQYIHFEEDGVTVVFFQLYTGSGTQVGSVASLYSSSRSVSRPVTNNQEYYIRIVQRDGSGAYKIAFNASETPPPTE